MRYFAPIADFVTGGRLRTRVRSSASEIFLTFDDGPHPLYTGRILSLLEQYRASATFFLIGANALKHQDVVRDIVAKGHKIGNHSFSHPRWRKISRALRHSEVSRTDAVLANFDGQEKHDFRPPRGEIAVSSALSCICRRARITHWSRDSYDYRLSADAVVSGMRLPRVRPGDIILFHDDQPVAAEALEVLLPEWVAQGMSCRRLPD